MMKRIVLLGPILFGTVITALTILKYDFLRGLGWDPLHDPTFDWPSGLALGPYGFIMTSTFIASGLLMSLLAVRLHAELNQHSHRSCREQRRHAGPQDCSAYARRQRKPAAASTIGSALLICAGLALAGLAFTTDPTIRSTPASLHGQLHDTCFVVLGLTLMPSMLVLGKAFRDDPRWRGFGIYTWLTTALAIPTFTLKGAAFYVLLLAVLVWSELVAWKLVRDAHHVSF